jgi:glycosyltransferase involved in cell wall biosynthesis|tara:strand:+ start:672 stop:1655 length:984 start_codon:yes stop_codon:yes gene_type:complete
VEEKSRILKKVNDDQSRPVSFNDSFGGSENQLRLLLKYLPDESFKNINLILNNANHDLIEKDKINILWMHHFVNQKEAQNLSSKDFVQELDYIVFNSNWNSENHIYQFKIPKNKSVVIKNAIEKIDFEEKPKDKINLIYHTTPWRGLALLLNVFKNLNLKNVELNVCSSTIIYGKKFDSVLGKTYESIFNECKNTKNVNYFGFLDNKKIIQMLKKMHIFSHPSIWPETSCIAAIESMAAGCEVVTTNLGALSETCSSFGTFVNFDRNFDNLEKKYSEVLLNSIKNFWSDENQNKLKLQSKTINATYSWNVRSVEWKNFLDKARKLKS